MDANRIYFFDTTLRDGEQTPGVNFSVQEKTEIAKQLQRLKVDVIEAGFAGAGNAESLAIAEISREVRETTICSLCRALKRDIDAAHEALHLAAHPRIHVFIASSDLHLKQKLNMSREEALERTLDAVKYARNLCAEVEFTAEDATRADRDFLMRLIDAAIDGGARIIDIADTVGYAPVDEFGELICAVDAHVRRHDGVILGVHCHDDLGCAVANSLEGIKRGARQVECTINGLGERAGNAALEEIAAGIMTRGAYYGVNMALEMRQIYRTSRLVSSLSGIEVQPNKSVVGENAFLHQSGIHQHALMKDRATYEIIAPESVGLSVRCMPLGKLSGSHAFNQRIQELGYTLPDEERTQAFARFKALAERKKVVEDRDIEALINSNISEIPEVFRLNNYQVYAGNRMTATATLALERDGASMVEAAVGTGPVDAAFMAINKMTKIEAELDSYGIKAVTQGADALGEVTVRLKHGERAYMGKGVSTDVIEASIFAYIDAVNRIVADIAFTYNKR